MNTHDIGRGRSGQRAALGRVRARTVAAGERMTRTPPADGFPSASSSCCARG